MYPQLVTFIRDYYQSTDFIPLHAPVFNGHERDYVLETIDSTIVSSVGAFVDRFEQEIAAYTNSPKTVATVNGTAALHIALKLSGVGQGDFVITQPLTFVATCNAIAYCGAESVFIDVAQKTLSLSPQAMQVWLEEHAFVDDQQQCRHRDSGRIVRSCLPMHTFGHPADLDGLMQVCSAWHISLVEDAAESLGSFYKGKHTGTLGLIGTLSFNGNKIITTGGGGMILTNEFLGKRAKHITTTAKQPHPYEFVHDDVGYNYRLPNLNAALGCAQLERLEAFVAEKRALAGAYAELFNDSALHFVVEPEHCRSNYWLNSVICESQQQRDELLTVTNEAGVMTRPVWQLMNQLPMYQHAIKGNLPNAEWLAQRLVNLPSSVRS